MHLDHNRTTISRRSALAFSAGAISAAIPKAGTAAETPLRFILPVPAGTAVDLVARALRPDIERILQRDMVIEAKPGAFGSLGAEYVKRTDNPAVIGFLTSSSLFAGVMSLKNVPYDPVTDFTPVSRIGFFNWVLIVNKKIPAHTLKEFTAYAQAQPPNTLAFGRGAPYAYPLTAQFNVITKITAIDVPSSSGEPGSLLDLVAGRIQYMIAATTLAQQYIESGAVTPLAIASGERSPILADVPTMAEAGLPEYVPLDSFLAVVGPKSLPANEAQKISVAFTQALGRSDLKKVFRKMDFVPSPTSPHELSVFLAQQWKAWHDVQRRTGIQPK